MLLPINDPGAMVNIQKPKETTVFQSNVRLVRWEHYWDENTNQWYWQREHDGIQRKNPPRGFPDNYHWVDSYGG